MCSARLNVYGMNMACDQFSYCMGDFRPFIFLFNKSKATLAAYTHNSTLFSSILKQERTDATDMLEIQTKQVATE